ncbi:hypothetical protein GFS31_07960 [Leptolyngbya sp. BL0902]|uniref:hypothetical protein n=1 Tax=Leptolyngbya sp. BL0902 TaxID=1115757 RepID=UPI0018E879FD|nr:hypothetical protein [Leptolyngbya sp. BL0902]QQE64118.1 hypothetical protein GFS31_07960 [Leptolyngbya sp. BL0902]
MLPTFATDRDHALANHLMQPCLIRIIDNLRKATENLDWQIEYTQAQHWPEGTTEAQRQQVAELAAQLDQADADTVPQIEQALCQLPTPTPIYHLRLTQGERVATLDVWELCFRLCFVDYEPGQPVTVDESLVEADGEVDWITLDEKAKALITQALTAATA